MTSTCPVCGIQLFDDLNLNSQHVNMCIDDKASLDYLKEMEIKEQRTVIKAPKSSVISCPVCFKMDAIDSIHLKRCSKLKGINPKKMIEMIESRFKISSNSIFNDKSEFIEHKEYKKLPPNGNKKIIQKNKKNDASLHKNYILASTSNKQTLTLVSSVQQDLPKTELERLTFEEKREIVKKKIEKILSHNIVIDNQIVCSTTTLPQLWKISSLNEKCDFIVNGFEEFCKKLTLDDNLQNLKNAQNDLILINQKEELTFNLSQLLNNPNFSDIIIKVEEDQIVYAHSFIWQLNQLSELNLSQKPVVIECQEFSKQLMLKFLSFCYSGIIEIPSPMKKNLFKLANKFKCKPLIVRLASEV